jgi:hypothetical protein
MKRNFETMAQLKSAQEGLARDVSRSTGIPRIDDISGLFERLQIAHEAILERLRTIEDRLQRLESKPDGEGKKAKPKRAHGETPSNSGADS